MLEILTIIILVALQFEYVCSSSKNRHEKSNKEVISFAMLDACSQGILSTNKLMKDLVIDGTRIYINMKTVNGQERQSTHILDSIKVCILTTEVDKHQKWIKLPSSYTKEQIPVERSEMVTPAKLKQWQYLEKISSFFGENDNINVDLLIGANCVEALQPLEVIPSQKDRPYAYRTILGWCAVGPIVEEKQDVVSYNRKAVPQAENGSIAKHHFEVQNKCEDIGIKEMLKEVYMSDFQDTISEREESITGKMSEISNEDRRFLKILDAQTMKVGNHHQTPLSLKNPDVRLPNNRKMAERRLLYLKKRLMKDDRFHQQYTELMQETLEKSYAKESKSTPQDGRGWYLSHHGIYHPRKHDNIRVVFDCNSELNGRSINKELLMGPDLTNQLTGVLARFRQEEVAVMADIEKMYFQILVADEHISLLIFLWWKDGDMSKEIIDHDMCVYVLGGVSSEACSNYALRRTAIENEKSMAKILQRC